MKNGTISSRACTYRIVNKTRKSVCNIVIIIFFFLKFNICVTNKKVTIVLMLMYGKEASNRKQEIDRQHHTIPNKRTKDKHYGNVHNRLWNHG